MNISRRTLLAGTAAGVAIPAGALALPATDDARAETAIAALVRDYEATWAEGDAIMARDDEDAYDGISDRLSTLEYAVLDMPTHGFRSLAAKARFVKKCHARGLWIETRGEHLGDLESLIADIERLAGRAAS